MKINVKVNGEVKEFEIEAHEFLTEVLRRYGYLSVKRGCETGSCGVCTILMDGSPVPSCVLLAAKADGHELTTVEGVQEEATKIAEILTSEGVDQCGFCSPGFVLTVLGLKNELSNPTDEEIKHYLSGNLCRCTGYVGQLRAVKKYLGVE